MLGYNQIVESVVEQLSRDFSGFVQAKITEKRNKYIDEIPKDIPVFLKHGYSQGWNKQREIGVQYTLKNKLINEEDYFQMMRNTEIESHPIEDFDEESEFFSEDQDMDSAEINKVQ
jgi:hypothetical protein